jgi:hypothetical protein
MMRDRFGLKGQAYCPVDERTFKACLRWKRPATV